MKINKVIRRFRLGQQSIISNVTEVFYLFFSLISLLKVHSHAYVPVESDEYTARAYRKTRHID